MPQIRPSRIRNLALLACILMLCLYMIVKAAFPKDDFKDASRQNPEWKYSKREIDNVFGKVDGLPKPPHSRQKPAKKPIQSHPHLRDHLSQVADDSNRKNIYNNIDNLENFDLDGFFDRDYDEYDDYFDDEDTDYYYENSESCPEYGRYSTMPHYPLSQGPLRLPYQRPIPACRTFKSQAVEDLITKFNHELGDLDLARLFENCFPNTLDTTIRWHYNGTTNENGNSNSNSNGNGNGNGNSNSNSKRVNTSPQTFIVTGDINAEWLRDSYRQLLPYIPLLNEDSNLKTLVLGAINTQAYFVSQFPYCNAFHPPPASRIRVPHHNADDKVFPPVDPRVVFECKYELDSLASFLGLSNEYYKVTKDISFVDDQWLNALAKLLEVLDEQSIPTYVNHGTGTANIPKYTFQRNTNTGTETLNLAGMGNPVNANISLIRSAFRPSDDATIYQYFIPANAQISVELKRAAEILSVTNHQPISTKLLALGNSIERAIWDHGVYHHKIFGDVFAYEIDGYGGIISLDDANLPSLLSLPILGFLEKSHPIYQNTRKMILSKTGNPYYLHGRWFSGIGGPHIGIHNAWPMSLLVAIRTSDDDEEIEALLDIIKKSTAGLGLMHESVNVDVPFSYTRPWFAWANSEFAQTLIDISQRKPHIIFDDSHSQPPTPPPAPPSPQQPQQPLIAEGKI